MTAIRKNSFSSLHHQLEQAIARGESNERICTDLGVTPFTVDEARDFMDKLCDGEDTDEDEPATGPAAVAHKDLGSRALDYKAQPMGDTAGYAALAEAMRFEQARIYGALQHEHRQPRVPAVAVSDAEVVDLGSRRRRAS